MRRTALVLTLGATLLLLPLAIAQNGPDNTLAGCLTGQAGSFTLGAVPSGNNYRLTGNVSALNGHDRQMVRVTGRQLAAGNGAQAGTFEVQKVQVLASSCTAPLPNLKSPQAVTGKTGIRGTAVPDTDTSTAGRVTPGPDTHEGRAQMPGAHAPGTEPNQPAKQGPLAPPQWGQVGQSQTSGDRGAAAAERAEEEPNHTLGVNATPSYANPAAPVGRVGTQGGAGVSTEQPASPASGMETENPTASTTQSSGGAQGTSETKGAQATNSSGNTNTGMTKKPAKAHHHRRSSKKKNGTNTQGQQQQNPPSGTK